MENRHETPQKYHAGGHVWLSGLLVKIVGALRDIGVSQNNLYIFPSKDPHNPSIIPTCRLGSLAPPLSEKLPDIGLPGCQVVASLRKRRAASSNPSNRIRCGGGSAGFRV